MQESSTYRFIEAEGARKLLIYQGTLQFGPPDLATRRALEAITELKPLERLAGRLLKVSSWEQLLAPPHTRRRNGRRK